MLFVFLAASALISCAGSATTRDPGTLVFLIETMPTNLDPRIGTDAQSQRLHSLIFSSLLERDAGMNLRGDLAERWESTDPLTYVFHLRREVRFHNGRSLTSADVKYTFDSMLSGDLKTTKRGAFRMLDNVSAPDPYTVVFHLKEPFASFLWNLARPSVGIVPQGAGVGFAAKPVGSGPFRFVQARQDEEVILERFAGYFRLGSRDSETFGRVERVKFRIVPDATVRALELRKGSADVSLNSLAPDMVSVLAHDAHLAVTRQPGTTYVYLAFNLEDPVLARRQVRQALAYATNRQTLVSNLLQGQARVADSLLPPNHWAYAPAPPEATYAYDPARAERLLDAAGFPRRQNAPRLRLTLKTSTEETSRLIGAVLQQEWARVGIDLELRPYEFATLYADITRGTFQLYTLRWIGANNDPDIFEYVFHSRKVPPDGANRGRYRNALLDALVDRARVEPDREKRRGIYAEVQRIIAEDLPYLSLWYMDNVCVHRRTIAGVAIAPAGDYDFLSEVRIR